MYPVLFQLGPLTVYSYGLMLAIGFVAASLLAARRAKALGVDPARIQTLCLVTLVAGLVGARAAYVALRWPLFRDNPLEIFRLDHGGLVFYGGLAGGLLAAFLYLRRSRLRLGEVVDLLTPPLILAHALGRVGCFLNGCCYGKAAAASFPWAVTFPYEKVARHPTQLYEAAALVILFFIVSRLERRPHRPGSVFLTYGLLYGLWRFGIEFLRADTAPAAWGLTAFQWASIPLAAVCLLLLWAGRRKP